MCDLFTFYDNRNNMYICENENSLTRKTNRFIIDKHLHAYPIPIVYIVSNTGFLIIFFYMNLFPFCFYHFYS